MCTHHWQLPADAFCLGIAADIINSVAFGLELGALEYEEQEDGTVKLAALPMLQVLLSSINPNDVLINYHVIALRLVVCHVTSTMDVGRDALFECSCVLVHRTAQNWKVFNSCPIAVTLLSHCCHVPVKLLSCSCPTCLTCCKAVGKLELTSSFSALKLSSWRCLIFLL